MRCILFNLRRTFKGIRKASALNDKCRQHNTGGIGPLAIHAFPPLKIEVRGWKGSRRAILAESSPLASPPFPGLTPSRVSDDGSRKMAGYPSGKKEASFPPLTKTKKTFGERTQAMQSLSFDRGSCFPSPFADFRDTRDIPAAPDLHSHTVQLV